MKVFHTFYFLLFTYSFLSYVVGSIPTGLWLGQWWKGVDVRQQGSGNLGATNVFRVLGATAGVTTLLLDILKGALPVLGAQRLAPGSLALPLAAGLAAVVGHTKSIFVGFRGGKGVATSGGVFIALLPVSAGIALMTFAAVLAATRIVSIGSIVAVFALALSAWSLHAPPALCWAATGVALFVVWTHRGNLKRLAEGTEPRIVWNKTP